MSKVHIHLSRKITLSRPGKPDVPLQRGHNVVDADVAEHGFVKAHTVDIPTGADDGAVAALRAELAAEKQRADEIAAAIQRANAAVASLQAEVDAEKQRAATEKQRADELAAVLEAMSAEADKGGKRK